MNAWKYHTTLFLDDIRNFFESLYNGEREKNIGDGIVRDPNNSFHVADLAKKKERKDHLEHISRDNQVHFATSLTYVVLINQIVHSHFPDIHSEFWQKTRYPLVAGGLNPSRSPYDILDREVWAKRDITQDELVSSWTELTSHIKQDITAFERDQAPEIALTWEAFRASALQDNDVVAPEPWGLIVQDNLA